MRFCFCVFKQKTAYEMRISDWSSDVCASDLRVVARRLVGALARALDPPLLHQQLAIVVHVAVVGGDRAVGDQPEAVRRQLDEVREIGRASGRERVCEYG